MSKTSSLVPIYLLTFVNTLGFSLLLPILPFIVERYGGGALAYGFLLSAYSAFQFVGAPILGSLSDKYGRRPLLMISQLGTFLSWLIFAIAYFVPQSSHLFGYSLPLLIIAISRIADGITGGNISVANAYIADKTTGSERSIIYGNIGAIFGAGIILGPALGGLASATSYGYLGTLVVAIIISLITLAYIYFYLPESLDQEDRDHHIDLHLGRQINIFAKLTSYRSQPEILRYLYIRFLFTMVLSAYFSVLILFIKDQFQLNEQESGVVFLVIGTYIVINQGLVIKRLLKKFSDRKVLAMGQVVLGIGFILLFFTPSLWIFFLVAYITNLGITSSMPTITAILTSQVDRRQQGRITGLIESIISFGNATMPIVSGFLYQHYAKASFLMYAFVLVLGHFLIQRWYSSAALKR